MLRHIGHTVLTHDTHHRLLSPLSYIPNPLAPNPTLDRAMTSGHCARHSRTADSLDPQTHNPSQSKSQRPRSVHNPIPQVSHDTYHQLLTHVSCVYDRSHLPCLGPVDISRIPRRRPLSTCSHIHTPTPNTMSRRSTNRHDTRHHILSHVSYTYEPAQSVVLPWHCSMFIGMAGCRCHSLSTHSTHRHQYIASTQAAGLERN